MKYTNYRSSNTIWFCCFFVGLISSKSVFSQTNIIVATNHAETPMNFVVLSERANGCINFGDTLLYQLPIKEFKFKAKNCTYNSHVLECFYFTPNQLGKTKLKTKITFENGKKIKVVQNVVVIELPILDIIIDVTAPDSKFMWLKVIDKSTGLPIDFKYDICKLDFQLFDASGKTKENYAYTAKDDFFPSIRLQDLSSKFEINDKLEVGLSLIHLDYNLLISIQKSFIIDSLWK